MELVDIAIVVAYLVIAVSIGFFFKGKATGSLIDYFLAGRRLPALWLGLSIVATTFAADTPLAVTGIIADSGISGNWVWWIAVLNYSLVAVYFASRWRRAGVLTDVEFLNIRYARSGWLNRLRITKALLLGVVLNVIIMSWVILAMTKIVSAFLPVEYQTEEVSVLLTYAIVLVVVLYSFMSGLYGVVVTDLVQISIALVATYALAGFVLSEAGGWREFITTVNQLPAETLQLFPSDNTLWVFYLGFLWWATYSSDGTGYIAQRVNSSKDERSATLGMHLFIWAHFIVRMIPWLIVALFALIVYPDSQDEEQTYVLVMKDVMPVGWLGLGVTALVAAFMSTMDTHLNWGSSYLTNDVIKVLKPSLSNRELIKWGKASTVLLAVIAGTMSLFFSSIKQLWMLFFALSTGIGVANLLRWVWWRANQWTEWAALFGGIVFFTISVIADVDELERIAIAGTGALLSAIVVTLLTKPEPEEVIKQFEEKVKPIGIWKSSSIGDLTCLIVKWLIVSSSVVFSMLTIISILLDFQEKWVLLAVAGGSLIGLWLISRLCRAKE